MLAPPLVAGCAVALLGFLVVLTLIPIIIGKLAPFLARQERDLHHGNKTPVPRLGGLALAAVFAIVAPLTLAIVAPEAELMRARITISITALAMFALGFWDDLSPLGAKKKLFGQIIIALSAYYFGLQIDSFRNPLTGVVHQLGWLGIPATVFWLVALTNLVNLIDGIDGLAGGISLMLMALLAFVGVGGHTYSFFVSMGMAGALLAFLKFNFPPARIYLGDGGAYFLGYLIGALTIQNSNKGTVAAALIAPIFALALPILDVSFSIARRGLKGLPIFRPDRAHIHHRLLKAGFSRKRAVLTLYGLSMLFLLFAFVAFWSSGRLVPILFGCIFLVLLISAPSLGIIRNWLTIGTAVGNSLEMRNEVQYALLMRNWLEKEAARCDSVEELCSDLQFMARKLRFSEILLTAGRQRRQWQANEISTLSNKLSVRYELQVDGSPVTLDLKASKMDMEPLAFDTISDIVVEAWLSAAKRFRKAHDQPFYLANSPNAIVGQNATRRTTGETLAA